MIEFIYISPKELFLYLKGKKSVYSKQDNEILIALTARKAYEDKIANDEEMTIGFVLRSQLKKEFDEIKDTITTDKIGEILSKFGEQSTLTDVAIGKKKNGIQIGNPIEIQIKRYGLGREENGGTTELIKILKKHIFDAADKERLFIYLEKTRGILDVKEIIKHVDMDKFPYKEVVTMHYTEPDMHMHYIRLKPKQGSDYGYKVFTQEEVIGII
jgi:hypothetical protein